jgi:hypothetical protein
MNRTLVEGECVPERWSRAILVPVPKKAGAHALDQHRGISLLNSVPKLFNRILLERVQKKVEPLLRTEQNGFRPKRSTIQHVLALRRITEEAAAHKLEAHLVFVDYKKAFDSVNRETLSKLLEAYGIPPKLRDAILCHVRSAQCCCPHHRWPNSRLLNLNWCIARRLNGSFSLCIGDGCHHSLRHP